jgi:hypothetical protein
VREPGALGGEAGGEGQDHLARLLGNHVAQREGEPVAHARHAPRDRHAVPAGAHEVKVQRVRCAVLHGASRRHQRLRRQQPAEDTTLATAGVAEEAVLGQRREVEPSQQLLEWRPRRHASGPRNAGITCSPKSSTERITLSAGILYGFIRQSS